MSRPDTRNPLAAKLGQVLTLTDEERGVLDQLVSKPRRYAAGEDVLTEGEPSDYVHVVLEGAAVRYKYLPDGARQNMALLLPGDPCDLQVFLLTRMDHSIGTTVPSILAKIPREEILEILHSRPRLTTALWWNTLQDEAVLREWLLNVGRRRAPQRLAHLFWEIYLRFDVVGLTVDHSYTLPLTQAELGDAMGMSLVHVNRSLQALRNDRLITLEARVLTIPDPERLQAFTDFDPSYLHLYEGVRGDIQSNFERRQ